MNIVGEILLWPMVIEIPTKIIVAWKTFRFEVRSGFSFPRPIEGDFT